MAWRDEILPASYKGVPCYVAQRNSQYGRRLVINQYPYRDKPYVEDMGAQAARYEFSAYVVGDNYHIQRNALKEAIEAGGVGNLIHPDFGSLDVICESVTISESENEGAFAQFDLVFVEAGAKIYPSNESSPLDLVDSTAGSVIVAAQDTFISSVELDGVIGWVRDSYKTGITSVSAKLEQIQNLGGINKQFGLDIISQAATGLQNITGGVFEITELAEFIEQDTTELINNAADWVANLEELKDPANTLLDDVEATALKIISNFAGLIDLSPSLENLSSSLTRLFESETVEADYDDDEFITDQTQIATSNQSALDEFTQSIVVAVEAQVKSKITYSSYEEAVEARDEILTKIDSIISTTTDDNVFSAQQELRVAVSNAMPLNSDDLPRIGNIKTAQTLPSLALSYELYGNLNRESDIIIRNNVRHPGFMPGGVDIKVLEDA